MPWVAPFTESDYPVPNCPIDRLLHVLQNLLMRPWDVQQPPVGPGTSGQHTVSHRHVMSIVRAVCVLAACGGLWGAPGCATPEVSARNATATAEELLRSHNLKPEDFDPPEVRHNTSTHRWLVTYWPEGRPADFEVRVVIHERTGKVVSASQGLRSLQ